MLTSYRKWKSMGKRLDSPLICQSKSGHGGPCEDLLMREAALVQDDLQPPCWLERTSGIQRVKWWRSKLLQSIRPSDSACRVPAPLETVKLLPTDVPVDVNCWNWGCISAEAGYVSSQECSSPFSTCRGCTRDWPCTPWKRTSSFTTGSAISRWGSPLPPTSAIWLSPRLGKHRSPMQWAWLKCYIALPFEKDLVVHGENGGLMASRQE